MAHADHVETHFTGQQFCSRRGHRNGRRIDGAVRAGGRPFGSGAEYSTDRGGRTWRRLRQARSRWDSGGYLAARGDAEHYEQERTREYREIKEIPEEEMAEVGRVFQAYGMTEQERAAGGGGAQPASRRVGRFHDAL